MLARHGIKCEDWRKVTMHGNDIADGDGSAVSGMLKNPSMKTTAMDPGILFDIWHTNIQTQKLSTIHTISE